MCGIAGLAGFSDPALLRLMCDALAHRGPDGEGMTEDPEAAISLGMRRLAIIDLVTGDQPFFAAEGRVRLVFNGEIYNFRELREELRGEGHGFSTQSDTEVVLAAYLQWGAAAWPRLHGMFAIAILDARVEPARLLVVRDRVGMKPLYYAERAGRLAFASEMKALLHWPDLAPTVSLGAVRDYLALRYVPGPGSLLVGVRKLPAAHMLVFAAGRLSIEPWWTPPDPDGAGEVREAEARGRLGDALRLAVRRHLVADVPIGAFLSGGVDSSVIVALMAEVAASPVHTFSIGFPDFARDELDRAALTARTLGTRHTAIECTADDMAALPDIAWSLDEPVGDPIVVPMYALARNARRDVKVVLSGEGADEILGGYVFHRRLVQLERTRRSVPPAAWGVVARAVNATPVGLLDRLFDYPGALGSEGRRKLARLVAALGRDELVSLYRRSIALFEEDDIEAATVPDLLAPALPSLRTVAVTGTPLQRLVRAQFHDWLPDDILMKADKMTMAHGLELRVPFMDETVIRAAAALPDAAKLGPSGNKLALRDFAATLLPDAVARSPKQAFYAPLEAYMDRPRVRDLFRRTLDPARIRRRGLFRPEWISAAEAAPRSAGFLPLKRLFAIVMLELWFERFAPEASWA